MGASASLSEYNVTSCKKKEQLETQWYAADSDESQIWQQAEDGFGRARNKSFRTGATIHSSMNRKGNHDGELAGRIVFYSRASGKTDYSHRPLDPSFDVQSTTSRIHAKAFFGVPTGMMPIGENNIPYRKHSSKPGAINYKGYGPILLAPLVRAVALFVHVDGVPKTNEVICAKSTEDDDNMRQVSSQEVNDAGVTEDEDTYPIVTQAIQGSFVTFCPGRTQDTYFFIQFPIVGTQDDCLGIQTGSYAPTVADTFHKLFCSLSPGKHNIRVSVQIYYDHSEFRYFALDTNLNARGEWFGPLPNSVLDEPYTDESYALSSPSGPISEGLFTVQIPAGFSKTFDGMLDRKPPKGKYKEDDVESVRKDAGVVAMGKLSKLFDLQGLPDITVLTSDQQRVSEKNKSGQSFTFEYIEFVSCWLDPNDSSPAGTGTMYECAMVKGQISAEEFTGTWGWYNRRVRGEQVNPEPIQVKNRHILARMVERRRSEIDQLDLPKRLIELSKKEKAKKGT